MSSQLKISADTSEVKKSILDIGKSLKDLKGSSVKIFSPEDKKFLKGEMKKEIGLMKAKLKENRDEISKLVSEQKKLTAGSDEELENRKKILAAYKTQAQLGRQLGQTQKASKGGMGGGSGGGIDFGGIGTALMNFARLIPGLAAIATVGYAVTKGMKANDQYVAGAPNRNKLKGLGVSEENFGSAQELSRVGLSEQDMVQRRVEATATLGRDGTSNDTEMRKAGFERAFGLEGGSMTGMATQMRGQMGGKGATDAQMKLQASVFAAGIEDAVGPYLESAVQLLTHINENGMTNTAEMTSMLAQLTKDGQRTPEQMAKTFGGMNDAVKGASGEASAFLQTAFARAGIGGGTIGGTKFAMESGGIMGMNGDELSKRGYNPELLKNMESSGMIGGQNGLGKRSGAILDMMKSAGGLKTGESISGITDPDKMVGMGNLASKTLGIKDPAQAFDALMMMEKVQKKQMTQKTFDEKLKKMQEGSDPSVERLDKINNTLSGQTEILRLINTNLTETLGKEAVQAGNQIVRTDNEGIIGVKNVAGAINDSGATQAAGDASAGLMGKINQGKLGEGLYDKMFAKSDAAKQQRETSPEAVIEMSKKRRDKGEAFKGWSDAEIEDKVRASMAKQLTAKDIGQEVANAIKGAPIVNKTTNKIQLPDGKVVDRTTK